MVDAHDSARDALFPCELEAIGWDAEPPAQWWHYLGDDKFQFG